MVEPRKTLHEELAVFFENPNRVTLKDILKRHFGELDDLDFKKEFPRDSNIARHILAMANSGGGCIIFGVEQQEDNSFDAIGLDVLRDKAEIQQGLKKYLPAQLDYCVCDYAYKDSEYEKIKDKKFQVIIIENKPRYLPFVSESAGTGIKNATIYVRRGTSSVRANYAELQKVINRRIDTGYSSQREMELEEHIEQLQLLYKQIDEYIIINRHSQLDLIYKAAVSAFGPICGKTETRINPKFPTESIEEFIIKRIEDKKKLIKKIIGTENE